MTIHELEEYNNLDLQFGKRGGILPVIVQEHKSKEILMLGYTNQEAFDKTLSTGLATFWSTSRKEIWTKGETSGDILKIEHIKVDCDQDALIFLVSLMGSGACHTKNTQGQTRKTCFYRVYNSKEDNLENLDP
ncbi:phosphoribosyl-AMP cyclohydrolase [Catalinimonas niigatensis]|uniref:phosphoribosyl-AMP cyclohydrolase n=1 Tax=Catalinimonas niigatensis TaxID=1397264 RepID=UPI0026662E13|nr:phosphoribosyl-AMP cyclohydrolase [Catalinimonas niigatensis]WPP50557.1 phosphoribosyl-AMP cyclohydrolase [Catalinimonas niigatensis]